MNSAAPVHSSPRSTRRSGTRNTRYAHADPRRKYEAPRQWRRTTRVYCEPGRCDAWFFQTREGIDVGPYLSQFAAEVESSLLKEMLAQESCQEARVKRVINFMQESLELEANCA